MCLFGVKDKSSGGIAFRFGVMMTLRSCQPRFIGIERWTPISHPTIADYGSALLRFESRLKDAIDAYLPNLYQEFRDPGTGKFCSSAKAFTVVRAKNSQLSKRGVVRCVRFEYVDIVT